MILSPKIFCAKGITEFVDQDAMYQSYPSAQVAVQFDPDEAKRQQKNAERVARKRSEIVTGRGELHQDGNGRLGSDY